MIYQNLSRKEKIMRYNNIGKNKENGIVYTPTEMADYVAKEMIKYKKT